MNNFLTYDTLLIYTNFITVVFMVVEFTKEIPGVRKIPTKYWSFFISLFLLVFTNIVLNYFVFEDIFLYVLSSIAVSLGSNGIHDFNEGKE